MSNNSSISEKIVDQCAQLLKQEASFAQLYDIIAVFAFAMAIFFLLRRAHIAITKLQAADVQVQLDKDGMARLSLTDAKGMIDALKGLAAALKDTPASVTLALIALAFLFIPSTNVGAPCEDILKTKVESELTGAEERQANFKALVDKKPATLEVTQEKGVITTKATWPEKPRPPKQAED